MVRTGPTDRLCFFDPDIIDCRRRTACGASHRRDCEFGWPRHRATCRLDHPEAPTECLNGCIDVTAIDEIGNRMLHDDFCPVPDTLPRATSYHLGEFRIGPYRASITPPATSDGWRPTPYVEPAKPRWTARAIQRIGRRGFYWGLLGFGVPLYFLNFGPGGDALRMFIGAVAMVVSAALLGMDVPNRVRTPPPPRGTYVVDHHAPVKVDPADFQPRLKLPPPNPRVARPSRGGDARWRFEVDFRFRIRRR